MVPEDYKLNLLPDHSRFFILIGKQAKWDDILVEMRVPDNQVDKSGYCGGSPPSINMSTNNY